MNMVILKALWCSNNLFSCIDRFAAFARWIYAFQGQNGYICGVNDERLLKFLWSIVYIYIHEPAQPTR